MTAIVSKTAVKYLLSEHVIVLIIIRFIFIDAVKIEIFATLYFAIFVFVTVSMS